MGGAYNPPTTSTGVKTLEHDATLVTWTDDALTLQKTLSGLTFSSNATYRVTLLGRQTAGAAKRVQYQLRLYDGSNETAGTTLTAAAGAARALTFIWHFAQVSGTTTSYLMSGHVDYGGTWASEASTGALAGGSTFAATTALRIYGGEPDAGATVTIDKVTIEELS